MCVFILLFLQQNIQNQDLLLAAMGGRDQNSHLTQPDLHLGLAQKRILNTHSGF